MADDEKRVSPVSDDDNKQHSFRKPVTTRLPWLPKVDIRDDVYDENDGSVDPVYRAKAKLVNEALTNIGMGRYQWQLFFTCGFGWASDAVWSAVVGVLLVPTQIEYRFSTRMAAFIPLAVQLGLLVGVAFWGLAADITGRRLVFNATLFFPAVFAMGAGGSTGFTPLAVLLAFVAFGVGGNVPIDSVVFLDVLPASHQYLLAFMGIWFAIGAIFAVLVGWGFLTKYGCVPSVLHPICTRSENMGWRYLLFTIGAITLALWAIRFFLIPMFESPRYLIGRGKDEEAIEVLNKIARINRNPDAQTLTLEDLQRHGTFTRTSNSKLGGSHIKALFASPKLAYTTGQLMWIWCIIGLATTLYNSFLPLLFQIKGEVFKDGSIDITFRNQVFLALIGLPAAFIGTYASNIPKFGRKGTLALSTLLTGTFLLASTTATSSNNLLAFNCGYQFFNSVQSAILVAYSAELFPAKDRGTGNALIGVSSRIGSVMGPVISLYQPTGVSAPVYVAGGIFFLAGLSILTIPYESQGHSAL